MEITQDQKPAAKSELFSIINPGPRVTIYSVGKKRKFLNHDDKEAQMAKEKVPVATQAQLKEMYDADSTYAKFVKPPAGYKAPWYKAK